MLTVIMVKRTITVILVTIIISSTVPQACETPLAYEPPVSPTWLVFDDEIVQLQ